MRSRCLLASVLLAFVSFGCDDDGYTYNDQSEIVFGIRQETGTNGKATVSAEYEFLSLARQGGWITQIFRDGDGDGLCYFERFDHRIGRPRVENGVALFRGGSLPAGGLEIFANQSDPVMQDGVGWTSGDLLAFDVSGFAMPPVRSVNLTAPPTTLSITSLSPAITPGETTLAVKGSDDIRVTWAPVDDPYSSHIMVSLVTQEADGPGGEVRCFASSMSGSAIIPSLWVGRLFQSVDSSSPVEGHLEIASHKQVTVHARSDWTVYVVATSVHRNQWFTGTR
jgi:hypothetical protein